MFDLPLLVDQTSLYAELGVSPEALADEIREAKAEASAALDAERAALDRELRDLDSASARAREIQRAIEEIDRRKVRLNQITIDNPDERQQYDREHPPFGLLKLDDASRDGFVESRTALTLVRRELSRFFAERNEDVFHPSDLHREDFTADITPHPLLDDAHA
jgi:hypothetical protein